MALEHTTAVRDALANEVVDTIDVGGAGSLIIVTDYNGLDTEVATLPFGNPAFDAAGSAGGNADGVATANTITDDSSATGNASAVDGFIIKNGATTEVVRGTVSDTGGAGDIKLSSTTIAALDTVSISLLTYTASA